MAEEEKKKEEQEATGAEEEQATAEAEEAAATAAETEEAAESKPARKKEAPKKKARSRKKEETREAPVVTIKALAKKDFKLSPDVFEVEPKTGLLHQVVCAELAGRRQGAAATKTRAMVRGGGAKPWRQKGTGRARAGSSRMPHWTGGGVAFGPSPRDYSVKVNRKERQRALKMALSARASEGSLKVVKSLAFDEPKTAQASATLDSLEVEYPLLVLTDESDTNAELSFRNLLEVEVRSTRDLDVTEIVGARTVLLSKPALENLNKLGEKK